MNEKEKEPCTNKAPNLSVAGGITTERVDIHVYTLPAIMWLDLKRICKRISQMICGLFEAALIWAQEMYRKFL